MRQESMNRSTSALLEPDHPAELVGGDHALVDEPVEAAQGHAEVLGRLLGAHPMDLFVHRAPGSSATLAHRAHLCLPMISRACDGASVRQSTVDEVRDRWSRARTIAAAASGRQ